MSPAELLEMAILEIVNAIRNSPDPRSAAERAKRALETDAFDLALDEAADQILKGE